MDTIMDLGNNTLGRVLARAPIYDLILSCLAPRSLVWLAFTCRTAYFAVADFKSRAYNINRHFSRYFSDPLAFRSLQAKTNTLVSGSNALQFLDRSFYPEADLDIYTHPGHSFEVAQFLVESEGYQYVPREDQEDWKEEIESDWDGTERRVTLSGYPIQGITGVYTFEKASVNGEETLKIQIIEAASSPVEAILDFHSTCVMNFITSEAAYSLYPIATFVARCSLGMPSARKSHKAIQKYLQRGWRIYFAPTPDDLAYPTGPPFMLDQTRWVGDKHTWVLPLDQTGVKARPPLSRASAPLTFDHVRCNGWTVKLYAKSFGYETHVHQLQTTIFRYNYGLPDEALWLSIREWANEQGRMCHLNIAKEDWVWFDADLPGFVREYCKRVESGSFPKRKMEELG